MKALWKYKLLNKKTRLPWGACVSLSVSTGTNWSRHIIWIDHTVKAFGGKIICKVAPAIYHNMENRVTLDSLPSDLVWPRTMLDVINPSLGDTVLIIGHVVGDGVVGAADQLSGAIFRYTGHCWQPLPYADSKGFTRWRIATGGGKRILYLHSYYPLRLGLLVPGSTFVEFCEECGRNELNATFSWLPTLPLQRGDFLDFVGGRKSAQDLVQIGGLRVNRLIKSQHESIRKLGREIALLKTVCTECADALWETRGISASAKFVDIRKKLEREALGMERVEQGTKKGQPVPYVSIPSVGIEE